MSCSISTVIPTYNVAAHLAQAIQSVLEQTRAAEQIIIVDDCSSDNTLQIARSFKDPRIEILGTLKNSGSATARNIGIQAATGNLIALLDGDDFWHRDHLETVAGLLDRHPTATLAFSPTQAFGAENWTWPIRIAANEPVDCFWNCLNRTIVPHMNVVVRRTALLEVGGYREQLLQAQDYDLFLRLAFNHLFVCTETVTSKYRRHSGSITLRNPTNALHCMYRARQLFDQEMAARISPIELETFRGRCLDLWETALTSCVIRRNWRLMDFHLAQAQYVPGAKARLWAWKLRRAAGTVQWIWSAANRQILRKAA